MTGAAAAAATRVLSLVPQAHGTDATDTRAAASLAYDGAAASGATLVVAVQWKARAVVLLAR